MSAFLDILDLSIGYPDLGLGRVHKHAAGIQHVHFSVAVEVGCGQLDITLTSNSPTVLWFVDTGPLHGTLTGTAPDLVYVPDQNYNGQDSFTFHVEEGATSSASAQVSVTIVPIEDVFFVVPAGAGAMDGSSWADAFAHPQDASDAAFVGDSVWLKAGTYKPRTPSDEVLLTLRDNCSYYGGFAGAENILTERPDPFTNPTILDGDADDNGTGDVLHVVYGASSCVIDGFYIAHGKTLDGVPGVDGSGAGVLNFSVQDVTVRNCHIAQSQAHDGGAVANAASTADFVNCIFEDNLADDGACVFNMRPYRSPVACSETTTPLKSSTAPPTGTVMAPPFMPLLTPPRFSRTVSL